MEAPSFIHKKISPPPPLKTKMYTNLQVIPKITPANLCKPIYDIIHYFTSIFPLESGKCGKEEEQLQKFEYLENEKSFFHEIKNIFHSF